VESHFALADPGSDYIFEADERAAYDEKEVGRIDVDILLLGCFLPPSPTLETVPSMILRRACWTPRGNVARDGQFSLLRRSCPLVDIDDAEFGFGDDLVELRRFDVERTVRGILYEPQEYFSTSSPT
jgi:hypothetical protein